MTSKVLRKTMKTVGMVRKEEEIAMLAVLPVDGLML
jgi:hypothetical protein